MFWDVKLCDLIPLFSPEEEGSMLIQNTGNHLPVYTVTSQKSAVFIERNITLEN
jgi:hypothetical protein